MPSKTKTSKNENIIFDTRRWAGIRHTWRLSFLCFEALKNRSYQRAADFSDYSLTLQPGQIDALTTLATARFALADFVGASQAYQKLFEGGGFSIALLHSYADSSAASKAAASGVRQLEDLQVRFLSQHPDYLRDIEIEMAGLMLMSGNNRRAQSLGNVAPERMGRLGHWYYRAGDYSTAQTLLSNATAQRPDNPTLQSSLAWVELEQQRWDSAIQRFSTTERAGRAVAYWKAGRTQNALDDFNVVVKEMPEWSNVAWVSGLYTPLVSDTVRAIAAERAKRNRS